MSTIEIENLLSEAFRGGELRRRELRLTDWEAEYIRTHFQADLTSLERGPEKSWYEIIFRGAES